MKVLEEYASAASQQLHSSLQHGRDEETQNKNRRKKMFTQTGQVKVQIDSQL